ncbi:venom prothrombin activator pseutarin-C non-catalytic subunit-like [Lethenteron reissneri]|uniref:venom prothrombin activator pseutarin-C non-catalytic subunit-like n=1 Tax=Lethenteron reissneri TaxID=7753 RepID=UPI002AB64E3A|nr:venom prothrombin activator pseutarin-C non-catalytic subunit-like [Lethenteron reissneri]
MRWWLVVVVAVVVPLGHARTWRHFLAAEERPWDFGTRGARWETKAVFVGYKDATFQDDIPTEPWQGLLGPVLRAEVGDTIEVVFLNRASKPYSMHAHGVAYRKSSEGAAYADGTSTEQDKADDAVAPGQRHTYVWRVAEGPTDVDPECLTYAYHSHVDTVKDSGSGLYGAIVVCRNGSLDAHGRQKLAERSIVLAFASDSQAHSWYSARSELTYTINGFERGHIPGLTLCDEGKHDPPPAVPPIRLGGHSRCTWRGLSTTLEVAPEFTGRGRVFSTLTAHLLESTTLEVAPEFTGRGECSARSPAR